MILPVSEATGTHSARQPCMHFALQTEEHATASTGNAAFVPVRYSAFAACDISCSTSDKRSQQLSRWVSLQFASHRVQIAGAAFRDT